MTWSDKCKWHLDNSVAKQKAIPSHPRKDILFRRGTVSHCLPWNWFDSSQDIIERRIYCDGWPQKSPENISVGTQTQKNHCSTDKARERTRKAERNFKSFFCHSKWIIKSLLRCHFAFWRLEKSLRNLSLVQVSMTAFISYFFILTNIFWF